jgi:cell wall-associated NlpC family hydrolase
MKIGTYVICIGLIVVNSVAMATVTKETTTAISDDSLGQFIHQNKLFSQIVVTSTHVGNKASDLVMQALSFIGLPYKFGGTNAETGFDCSGFVMSVYKNAVGLILPRQARQQAEFTEKISRADLKPGDLVFFNTRHKSYSHVGIYVGDNRFVHAPTSGSDVRIDNLNAPYWNRHFDGARKVNLDTTHLEVDNLTSTINSIALSD